MNFLVFFQYKSKDEKKEFYDDKTVISVIVDEKKIIKISDLREYLIDAISFNWAKRLLNKKYENNKESKKWLIISALPFAFCMAFLIAWLHTKGIGNHDFYKNFWLLYLCFIFFSVSIMFLLISLYYRLKNYLGVFKNIKIKSNYLGIEFSSEKEENTLKDLPVKINEWLIIFLTHLLRINLNTYNHNITLNFYLKNPENEKIVREYMKFIKTALKNENIKIKYKIKK